VHPLLIRIGSFEIYTYGFFVALGILSAILWPAWVARRTKHPAGIQETVILDLGLFVLGGALVGSRLEYVRTHWDEFSRTPKAIFDLREGGFVFYGGLVLVVLLCLAYLRIRRIDPAPYADIAAPAIALGQAVGRLGCFFAGCCYGKPTTLPWGIKFPASGLAPAGIALHPTQLYESFVMFGMLAFFWWYRSRVRFPGENMLLYSMAYPMWRSINELFRGDPERGWAFEGVLTNGQATSIVIASVAAILWVVLRKRAKRAAATQS
jgi:phosphatidylglycerol---prolipoprotein diacylglyceryl transferase